MKLCPHNRQKSRCFECGGSEACVHNKRKSRCYQCNNMCIHNHIKHSCEECFISSILK